jgi:hypothetical protein
MSGMSRRELLRASAGAAAVAVPMSVLAGHVADAGTVESTAEPSLDATEMASSGPVMFHVLDAAAGEVSILHGESEVVVHDRALVARILRAASRAKV